MGIFTRKSKQEREFDKNKPWRPHDVDYLIDMQDEYWKLLGEVEQMEMDLQHKKSILAKNRREIIKLQNDFIVTDYWDRFKEYCTKHGYSFNIPKPWDKRN